MTQYIDKADIVAEIEKRNKETESMQPKFGIRTKVYSIEKAWDLAVALRKVGAEGPQNDSLRYVPENIIHAFRGEDYCWIGLCGKNPLYGYIRIISNHDRYGKKYFLDVSESKFIESLNLKVEKIELPKSLRRFKTL